MGVAMDVDYSQRVREMDRAVESLAQQVSIAWAVMALVVLALVVWAFLSWRKKGFPFFLSRFVFVLSILVAYIGLSFLIEGPRRAEGVALLFLSFLGFFGSFFMSRSLKDSPCAEGEG